MDVKDREEKFDFGEGLEKKILHSAITNHKFLIAIVDHVKKEYFSSDGAQLVYRIVYDYFSEHKEIISKEVFSRYFKKFTIDKSAEVKSEFGKFAVSVYATKVSEGENEYLINECILFCKRQAYINAILNASSLIEADNFGSINDQFRIASMIGVISEDEIDLFKDPEARIKGEIFEGDTIPTGIPTLNNLVLHGGWNYQAHPLVIIMAPSGIGKSIALCHFGSIAVQSGFKVIHYTFELSLSATAARYDANLATIPINTRKEKAKQVAENLKKVQEHYKGKNSLIIKEYTACTTNILKADLDKKRDHGFVPDLILVDYLDIMRVGDNSFKGDNTYAIQQRISEDLRALAKEYKAPIITATQTNRGGVSTINKNSSTKSTNLEADSIADSYGKVKTADLIISINPLKQDVDQIAGGDDVIETKANLYVAKNRNGPTSKSIPITIQYNYMRFVPEEHTTEEVKSNIETKKTYMESVTGLSDTFDDDVNFDA